MATARLCSKPEPAPAPLQAALPAFPIAVLGIGMGHETLVTSNGQLSPVLTTLLIGIRNEVALGLGVVVVLRWREDEGWQVTCRDKDKNPLTPTAPPRTGILAKHPQALSLPSMQPVSPLATAVPAEMATSSPQRTGGWLAHTYFGHRKRHRHGHADKESRQEDLREERLGVALGAVEAFDDQPMELAQLQPRALQLEAPLPSQVIVLCLRLLVWDGRSMSAPGTAAPVPTLAPGR